MTQPLKPVAVKQLLGIRNVLRPERQPWGACADAVNVFVDDSFRIERRMGYIKDLDVTTGEATDLYAPWSCDDVLFAIIDGVLVSLNETLTPTVVVSDLTDTVLQWTDLGDRVFYAGAVDAGVIVGRAGWQPLRIPIPDVTVLIGTGYACDAGQYQVCATLTHTASGVEGPVSPIEVVNLDAGELLDVQVTPVTGYTANIYRTEANGSVLYCNGMPLDHVQRDAEALPTGITALAAAPGGVLYAATHDALNNVGFVFTSQPFAFTCWRLDTDYLAVPGKVVGIAPIPKAVLVATDEAIWRWDGEWLERVAHYGAVPGRPIAYYQEGRPWIWTTHGLCVYTEEGWRNVTEERVSVPPGSWCTTQILERQGHLYLLAVTDGDGDPANAYGAVVGDAWAINLRNGELTRFDNFAFRAFGALDTVVFGLKADGIYALGGQTDTTEDPNAPDPIVARFTLHPTNFGDTTLKRCTYAYLTGCDEATLTVAVVCDGEVVGSYTGQRRVPLSRGIKGEFWAFEVSDQYGGPLRLTGFEILVEPTTRRV